MISGRKLPTGIQDFEKLRTSGCLYVDKTEYIYQLTKDVYPYFLGRPRRFGKSLLLSTLKAYFLGKKELFEGLAIAGLEKDWIEYPVIYIDFNFGTYNSFQTLTNVLSALLDDYESQWGITEKYSDLPVRFRKLIQTAYEKTNQKVVVLIDEYDKALTNTINKPKLNEQLRDFLKGFYGVMKSMDYCLRFVFLTGVTKFSKVSVFSDLNHLTDISLHEEYATICGISETELTGFLEPEITKLSVKLGKTYDETLNKLRKHYNGYHFAENTEGIYNPFSLLRTFAEGRIRDYWFETGTPTFLVHMLKKLDFDLKSLEKDVKIPARSLFEYRIGGKDPVPLLYQTGYLTIKDYNERSEYVLGFPNEEVKYGFIYELLPAYMPKTNITTEFYVGRFIDDLEASDVDSFMTRLKAFFAGIPYELENKTEKYFQTVFYLFFKLMGQYIEVEVHSATGRADAVVQTADTVYVFEFQITGNGDVRTALQQIETKGYAIPYSSGSKKIVKIGAEFNTTERGMSRWEYVMNANFHKAYFASGCFWGTEYWFMKAHGVQATTVGFMGGHVPNPAYPQVKTGTTGHLECVEVVYDTTLTNYDALLRLFFETHDFTQTDGQGPDIGSQYLSCIFYTDETEKTIAENCMRRLEDKGYKVATLLQSASTFWVAEDYHQQYYEHKGATPNCHSYRKIFE